MFCRVCFEKAHTNMDIFDERNKHLQIAETKQKHLGFKPLFDDTISKVVCVKCWLKIFDFHQIFKSVEYAQNNYTIICCNCKTVTVIT
uniref:ZAD domain-containing protein n=1 Tax=Glossina morsitans morsitans TaxID=37546 RepID=A0A1B0FFJ2_GLOMM